MTTRPPDPVSDGAEWRETPEAVPEPRPAEYAVSPEIGPVPAIYVPPGFRS